MGRLSTYGRSIMALLAVTVAAFIVGCVKNTVIQSAQERSGNNPAPVPAPTVENTQSPTQKQETTVTPAKRDNTTGGGMIPPPPPL